MFPVDQCKRDEVSNYELRQRRGREAPPNGLERMTNFTPVFPPVRSEGTCFSASWENMRSLATAR
jgi:hypothetical protein